jgi:hypothetical protein
MTANYNSLVRPASSGLLELGRSTWLGRQAEVEQDIDARRLEWVID